MLGQLGDIQSTNMYAYCANNPVMYLDPSGDFALLVFLAYCIVVPLFLMATYALFEESRPILDPIIENMSFSVSGGTGQGADFAKLGTFAGVGMAGFTCDAYGCRSVENSEQYNMFIYTYTSQYEDGKYKTYEGWGLGPIMMMHDGENSSLHLIFDFSSNVSPSTVVSFQVDIDLFGLIDGYVQLVKGWLE